MEGSLELACATSRATTATTLLPTSMVSRGCHGLSQVQVGPGGALNLSAAAKSAHIWAGSGGRGARKGVGAGVAPSPGRKGGATETQEVGVRRTGDKGGPHAAGRHDQRRMGGCG